MFESFLENAEHLIQHNPIMAIGAVFVGGLLTASNPCVLVSIPLVMAFVSGSDEVRKPGRAFVFSLSFVLGLSVTFTFMAVTAALLGGLLGDVGSYWKYVLTAVCLVMGLDLVGLYHLEIPAPRMMKPHYKGMVGAFLLGMLFGVVSIPCAAPILIVLLTYIASQRSNLPYGATLLMVYALGHCALILVAGTSAGAAKRIISSKSGGEILGLLRRAAGMVIVLVGLYFLFKG
ncbi:MAG: cytochrome c biogenesis protein CcdA [Candidatus Hydrogenedentota bacterium]|nr:MAG: cytochrome c biogenesis protein CcdA [Candidatus Hydrogenedentota bacterium]